MNQTLEKKDKKTVDTLRIGIYAIYDTVLQQFEYPFSCPESKINEYMSVLVNDPQSKYWLDEDSYILNKIASFSQENGEIKQCSIVERIQFLDKYIDKNKRQLQTIIQTLNYLPSGYFKMSQEQKEAIQKEIDDAITKYVSNYVIPDIDTSKLDAKIDDIKSAINKSLS